MFSCTAAQQINCTNTVQTLQSATEIYLPQLLSSCSYIFSTTTGQKTWSWCLLKRNAAGCLKSLVYIGKHIERLDNSNSCYWLRNSVTIWKWKEIIGCCKDNWHTVQTEGQLIYSLSQVPICVEIFLITLNFTVKSGSAVSFSHEIIILLFYVLIYITELQ